MNSLEEFRLVYGSGAPDATAPPVSTYEELRANYELVGQLKESIMEQLEKGNDPESILFTALQAISLATHDPSFLDVGGTFLNGDKIEQSFFLDLEAMQAKRDARRKAYFDKRRKEVKRQIDQLEDDVKTLYKELDQIPRPAE